MIREPFWHDLGPDKIRVVAIDVPYTFTPRTNSTVELSGHGRSGNHTGEGFVARITDGG